MNEGTAIEIAKGKMKELGISDYIIRYRHFRLDGQEELTLKSDNEIYIFMYPFFNVSVKSKMGLYDMQDAGINELQHIHSGQITVKNQTKIRLDVKFIQVIPITKK